MRELKYGFRNFLPAYLMITVLVSWSFVGEAVGQFHGRADWPAFFAYGGMLVLLLLIGVLSGAKRRRFLAEGTACEAQVIGVAYSENIWFRFFAVGYGYSRRGYGHHPFKVKVRYSNPQGNVQHSESKWLYYRLDVSPSDLAATVWIQDEHTSKPKHYIQVFYVVGE